MFAPSSGAGVFLPRRFLRRFLLFPFLGGVPSFSTVVLVLSGNTSVKRVRNDNDLRASLIWIALFDGIRWQRWLLDISIDWRLEVSLIVWFRRQDDGDCREESSGVAKILLFAFDARLDDSHGTNLRILIKSFHLTFQNLSCDTNSNERINNNAYRVKQSCWWLDPFLSKRPLCGAYPRRES